MLDAAAVEKTSQQNSLKNLMKDIADIVPTHSKKEIPKKLEVGALDFE